ncbi:S8 family serine peptidase [Rubrobacter indicoceani]|uniref:S8 family serine peptidase n=1 Tax=Rubrobacter indicoceani TaxID=2051957 RepID=UPI0013C4606F|nr:S8 family serine peptidase [Rubrobacter indicoceani]
MVLGRQFSTMVAALLVILLPVFVAGEATSLSPQGETSPEKEIGYNPAGEPVARGELIVVYKEDADKDVLFGEEPGRGTASFGEVRVEEELPALDAQVVEFSGLRESASRPEARALAGVKRELELNPVVEKVYYNYVRSGLAVPNDPGFVRQYGIKKVRFPATYGRYRDGVRVAVVDSGIERNHVDLRGKVVAGYDFRNDNATVEDLNGHGTFVSGIIAARTNNGVGVASGCPKCTLLAAKALDRDLLGYTSDIAQAINWSVDNGAKVVNLSLGSQAEKSIEEDAINRARSRGVVVTAAGGNYGTSVPVYPAAYPGAMAVAYTGPLDRTSSHSSYGDYIDVAAPGVDIYSTVPGGYATYSGSSFSAPHTAALAGVLMGQGRGSNATVKRVQATAADLGARGRDQRFGWGRIDAEKASRR